MATVINGSKHLPTTIDNTHLARPASTDEPTKKKKKLSR